VDNIAVLVRRYSPPLNRGQVLMLQARPYEYPQRIPPEHRRQALELKRLGLLEEDPGTRGMFRCTEIGQEVVRRWESKGWL
jgi:hypothetical protein